MNTDEIFPEISKQNFNSSTIYPKDSKLWPRRVYPYNAMLIQYSKKKKKKPVNATNHINKLKKKKK